jgi:hypothetical protein
MHQLAIQGIAGAFLGMLALVQCVGVHLEEATNFTQICLYSCGVARFINL